MFEYWIHTEKSFGSVVRTFANKPGAQEALAKVVFSPGFVDEFMLGKFLRQPGLADLVGEAIQLLGGGAARRLNRTFSDPRNHSFIQHCLMFRFTAIEIT